jgi:hypothetical protein
LKIYIAGRITGDADYKEKFRKAASYLSRNNRSILNPATAPAGMSAADYMRLSFVMIDICDAVVFLPDWEASPGARLEHAYCEYINKPYFCDLEGVNGILEVQGN